MLEKIENSSQQMMQSMSEIVWAIQPKNDDTANLVEKIHSFANELLSARNIRFRFEYPDQFLSIPIDDGGRKKYLPDFQRSTK